MVASLLPLTEVGAYEVTAYFGGDLTHKGATGVAVLTIVDDRPTAEILFGGEEVSVSYTEDSPVTEKAVFDLAKPYIVDQADNTKVLIDALEYVDSNVSFTTGTGDPIAAKDIKVAGDYYIVVNFPETSKIKAAESAKMSFKVKDGRNEVKIAVNEDVEVPFDFANNEVAESDILAKLEISVVDVTADPDVAVTDYSVSFKKGDNVVAPKDMKVGETYTAVIEFAGNRTQAPASANVDFKVVDARAATVLTLKEGVSFPYSPNYTEADIFEKVFDSLKTESGEPVAADADDYVIQYPAAMNVGSHNVTVKYNGDVNHKPAEATVEVTVTKAPVDVTVESKVVKYADIKGSGVNVSALASSDPTVDLITFAVGLGIGDNASADAEIAAYVNLPELIDVDGISNPVIKSAVERVLDGLGETSMNVSQLKTYLQGILNGLEGINSLFGINLDTEGIELLVSALEQIENLEGVGDLTVYLTMGKDIVVKDSGAYITGAVASDYNYESSIGLGYLAITPDGTKVDLAFNIEDVNGLITLKNIANGEYDLGSHVVESDTVSAETAADAQKRVRDLYIGVDYEGNPVIIQGATNAQSQMTIGAYTQVSYVRDLGNEMYYAMPIVRGFAVVTDLVDVKFVDSVGENNERQFTFDGTEKLMPAKAYDRAGVELDSANITYTYLGIEGDAEGYYSTGKAGVVEGPTEVGVYTVIATYVDYAPNGEPANVGMAIGAMVIAPAEASVEVNDATHVYNGDPYNVLSMIEKTPDDAKMAVVMAGFAGEGNFSVDNLSAVKGVVNIDFPTRVDNVLKQIVPSAYEQGITVDTLANKLAEIKASMEASDLGAEGVDELIALLEQMPNVTTLTFKEQADVNPSENGAYLVGAIIMDPNYQADVDLGILVIAPEFATVTFVDGNAQPNDDRQFTYDGKQHAMDVLVTNSAGEPIGLTLEGPVENLVVTYAGIEGDAEGYYSTTPPTEAGSYVVSAKYVERDDDGKLVRVGSAVGAMVIKPASTEFAVEDATHIYDGTEKFVEVSNPDALPYVVYAAVSDLDGNGKKEVNVIAPAGWNVEAREITDIEKTIETLVEDLKQKAEVTSDKDFAAAMNKLAEALEGIEIEKLSINGSKPVERGEYTVHAVAFGDSNKTPAYDSGLLKIIDAYSTIQVSLGADVVDVTVSYGSVVDQPVGTEQLNLPAGTTVTVKVAVKDAANKVLDQVGIETAAGGIIASSVDENGNVTFTTSADSIDHYLVFATVKDANAGGNDGGNGGDGTTGDDNNDGTGGDGDGADNGKDDEGGVTNGDKTDGDSSDASNSDKADNVIASTGDSNGFLMVIAGLVSVAAALVAVIAGRRWVMSR